MAMKLGFRPFRLFPGDNARVFDFAREIGADAVQINLPDDSAVAEILAHIDRTGVGVVSVIAMSVTMLGPDREAAERARANTARAIDVAARLGAPCVSQFAGHDWTRTIEENIEEFGHVYAPLAERAQENGVRLVFENCPMVRDTPRVLQNLAYCPANWRAMFEAVPSHALALEMDTGHFPYVGVDAVGAVEEFADRIKHVHVKDTRIDREAEHERGLLGGRPHEFCMPGEGDIDLDAFFDALARVGYDGFVTADLHAADEEQHHILADYMRAQFRRVG